MKRKNRKGKRKAKRKMPSQIDLVMNSASALVVAAHYRSGAGQHEDKRRKKAKKKNWKREDW